MNQCHQLSPLSPVRMNLGPVHHSPPKLTLAVEHSQLVLREDGEDRTLRNGDLIQINGRMAVVMMKPPAEVKPEAIEPQVVVRFAEEERVTVIISRGHEVWRVTGPRQVALLAELVGLRLRDRRRAVAPEEEGFTDKYYLSNALGIEPDYVNTVVTRLKARFHGYGFPRASALIETREADINAPTRAQQIRLTVPEVHII